MFADDYLFFFSKYKLIIYLNEDSIDYFVHLID